MTEPLPRDTGLGPRRTRICGPQSKFGCFTCKRRRIKCDEEKPVCLRCLRSRVNCEGYPKRESQSDTPVVATVTVSPPFTPDSNHFELPMVTLTSVESPLDGLFDYSSISPTQSRLANIGVGLLVRNFCDQFKFSISIFDILLPLLSHALPSVNAAAAALGAISEVQRTDSTDRDSEDTIAVEQYGLAVRYMQHDIEKQPFGRIPLMMICMLLACSELLLRKPSYALMHAEAAFNMFNAQTSRSNAASDDIPEFCNDDTGLTPVDEDDTFMLFCAFDLQVSSYTDRTPSLHSRTQKPPPDVVSHLFNMRDCQSYVISAVHDCLHFTSFASSLKYISTETLQSDVLGEQNRHIASLTVWVQRLDRCLSPGQANARCGKPQSESRSLLLMLRNLCLSTIILASTILTPYETAFDAYLWHFQQIVLAAEEILEERDSYQRAIREYYAICEIEMKATQPCFTFTPLPGLIQPLFFTASKCRHPKWRRRAIDLLHRSGREGPWVGKLVAVVAERLTEVEEAGSDFATFLLTRGEGDLIREDYGTGIGPSSIPEGARISSVALDVDMDIGKPSAVPPHDYKAGGWTAKSSSITRVLFSRCKDIDTMLDTTRTASNSPFSDESGLARHSVFRDNPMTESAFMKHTSEFAGGEPELLELNESFSDGMSTWKDEQFWDVWDEVLEFGVEKRKDA